MFSLSLSSLSQRAASSLFMEKRVRIASGTAWRNTFESFRGPQIVKSDYILVFVLMLLFIFLAVIPAVSPLRSLKGRDRTPFTVLFVALIIMVSNFLLLSLAYGMGPFGSRSLPIMGDVMLSDCANGLFGIGVALVLHSLFMTHRCKFGEPPSLSTFGSSPKRLWPAVAISILSLLTSTVFVIRLAADAQLSQVSPQITGVLSELRASQAVSVIGDILRIGITSWLVFCCFKHPNSSEAGKQIQGMLRCIVAPIVLVAAVVQIFLTIASIAIFNNASASSEAPAQVTLAFHITQGFAYWLASLFMIGGGRAVMNVSQPSKIVETSDIA